MYIWNSELWLFCKIRNPSPPPPFSTLKEWRPPVCWNSFSPVRLPIFGRELKELSSEKYRKKLVYPPILLDISGCNQRHLDFSWSVHYLLAVAISLYLCKHLRHVAQTYSLAHLTLMGTGNCNLAITWSCRLGVPWMNQQPHWTHRKNPKIHLNCF
jgi:hypothetical protein